MFTAAVDFETFYSDKVGVEEQGIMNYVRHPDFDAYLVTVVTDTGIIWSGHPHDFDWHSISGKDWQWLHHNASFDEAVLEFLRECGCIPSDALPHVTHCTADLCAYNSGPRALAKAIKFFFGHVISKSVRDAMKGKRWCDMTPEFQREAVSYAIGDSVWCLKLWQLLGPRWPDVERELSRHTRRMGWEGVPFDTEALDRHIPNLQGQVFEAGRQLPWYEDGMSKPLSPTALAAQCRAVGIVPPSSLAKDSVECIQWMEKYGEQYPWVKAMQTYRSGNALLEKLLAMRSRVMPSNWLNFGMLYFGATTTGRWSGAGGVNMQNLAAQLMFGINVRGLIKAPPGYKFINADLSQIEPRCLRWTTQNQPMLDALRSGMAIYEAHARASMGWKGGVLKKEDAQLYKLAKIRELGLGYGAGAEKFVAMAQGYDVSLTLAEATAIVQSYRASNKDVTGLWADMERAFGRAALSKTTFEVELPSGRIMRYFKPTLTSGLTSESVHQGNMMRRTWWGGSLTENLIQAMAREVFARQVLKVHKLGLPVLFHVHDELTCLCHENDADDALQAVLEVMREPPDFMSDLPLDAEGHVVDDYPLK